MILFQWGLWLSQDEHQHAHYIYKYINRQTYKKTIRPIFHTTKLTLAQYINCSSSVFLIIERPRETTQEFHSIYRIQRKWSRIINKHCFIWYIFSIAVGFLEFSGVISITWRMVIYHRPPIKIPAAWGTTGLCRGLKIFGSNGVYFGSPNNLNKRGSERLKHALGPTGDALEKKKKKRGWGGGGGGGGEPQCSISSLPSTLHA